MKNNYIFSGLEFRSLFVDVFRHGKKNQPKSANMKFGFVVVFFVMLFQSSFGQISVTVNNPTNTTPNLSANYASLANALTDLNAVTAMSGPVTLTLTGNETTPATGLTIGSASLNAVLSSTNTVTLLASGTVTLNAGVGTATPASAAPDGILKIVGADWITVDGLTFTDSNAANPATMEFGLGLFKLSLSDGASNNTIKNCTFNMQRINNASGGGPMVEGAVGICMVNSTPTAAGTALSPTTAAGTNSNNKFYTNTIRGGNYGMSLIGFAAASPFTAADTNNDVGGNSLATGNTILNFGGAAAATNPAAGIRTLAQYNLNVSYNTVNNNDGSGVNHVSTLRGIFLNTATSASATVNNNTVTVKSGATTSLLSGIENASGSTAASNTITINNNLITGCTYLGATTPTINGIVNSATPATSNMIGNTVTGFTIGTVGSANSVTFYGLYQSGGATNTNMNSNTVSNNIVNNQGGTIYCMRAVTTLLTANNNTIFNNSFPSNGGTLSASIYGIYDLASPTSETLQNNTIYSQTIAGNSTSTSSGIYGLYLNTTSASVKSWRNNTIYSFAYTNSSTGSATIYGIYTASGATINIGKNKIFDLSSSGASSVVSGIYVSSGTTVNITNNILGDLKTPSSNLANPLNGININGGTNVNAYHNTVMLNGSSTGALFGSSAINAATATTVELRNNIFVNNSSVSGAGLATAYRRSSTTLTSYAAASNNNLFYGSTIFTDGTNTDTTLGAFKTRVATRDASSISENPTFTTIDGFNPQFLHINTVTPTQIESGGTAIGSVTDDFDGDVRNVSTPDIGADEFAGTPLDLSGPIISHTQVSNICTAGSRVISATITDASGVPTAGVGLPVAYYNINGGAYSSAVASSLGAGVYEFTIGTGSVLGDVIRYYIVAQDNAGTPNVSALPLTGASGFTSNPPAVATPPTTPFIYSIVTPLNGVYTVGVSGNYTTLTAAVNDYNTKCLTGPVTFTLTDATYPSETFPITINTNGDASAVNTLTIKPATGIMPTISGSNATAIIKINGADYVTIDGSNNGSTSNDLTIENTNTATTGVVLWVASASASNAALNTTLKNTKYQGNAPTTTVANIVVSGTVLGAAAETPNNNLLISNNTFLRAQNGIFAIGNATTPDQGWVISNNVGGSSVAGDKLGFRGIAVQNAQGFVVSGNQILGVTTSTTSTTSGLLVGGAVTNGSIYNNKISNIKNTNTTGYGSNGILLNATSTSANISVYNNFIFDIASYGYASGATSADNGYGLFVNAGGGYAIYNNTITLNSNQTVSGLPAAINVGVGVTTPGAINLRNNILSNSQTQTGERYTIYSAAPNTVFAAIDYNDYATTGANLGYIGSARVDLPAIVTGFGGNTNSKNVVPVFVSATNLHLAPASNDNLNNFGTPIGLVTNDIDGELRNATTPDMGADEFTPVVSVVINNVGITPSGNQCTAVSRNVTANITAGSVDITSVTLNYSFNGVAQTPITMTGGTLTAGSTSTFNATIPVASPVNANVTWSVTAVDSFANKNTTGTAYQDEPLFGASATASASVPVICNSGSTELIALLSKSGTKDVGAGALTTSGSGVSGTNYVSPFTHYFGGYKAQYLIRASELSALGFVAGNNLTSMAFDVTTVGASATYTGFTVGIGQTTTNALTTTFDTSSVTQVYTGNLNVPAIGLLNLPFGTGAGSTASVVWDGTSNILVNLCWSNNNTGGGAAGSAEVKYDATSFVAMAYYRVDSQNQATVCGTTAATNTQSNRPKIVFGATNFYINPTAISWSDGSTVVGTGNNLVVSPTVTTTYTGTLTSNGCTIATNSVVVTVNNTAAPTGASPQSFNAGQTLADLVVTGSNIVWYASSSDAASAINPLPASTLLVNNTTYYATQTVSSCPSTASLAVLAQIALNTNGFDLSKFKFYPNPVHDILNIDYAQNISKVEVFNAVGQLVSVKYQTGVSTKVNMSTLSDGVYLIKLSSENSTQVIRVVKN